MDLLQLLSNWNIDPVIVGIVLSSGFFQNRYLCAFTWFKDARIDAAYKTLVVSFLASAIYVGLNYPHGTFSGAKCFISYFFTTSLYELLIKPFTQWVKQKTGDTTPTLPQ